MIPSSIAFTKLSAAGNDFICIDNTTGVFNEVLASPQLPGFVRGLCARATGVGADGLIFADRLGNGQGIDICARFLEPDGSEAELCGNGTACFTYWVVQLGLVAGPEVRILTAAGTAIGRVVDPTCQHVRVCVPDPLNLQSDLQLEVLGRHWELDYVVAGVPHAIAYVDNLQELDVPRWGAAIRWHPHFQPRGVNANFVEVVGEGRLALRTYEFGVEAETLACGTGSAAAAILTARRFGWGSPYRTGDQPVQVQVRGGETLKVWFTCTNDHDVSDVCLETRVRAVYSAVLRQELIAELQKAASETGA